MAIAGARLRRRGDLPDSSGRHLARGGTMTGGDDMAYLSALDLLDRYRGKSLSPVEVTQALLDRIDRLQPKLNAFIIVDRDGALAAARASEQRWRRGEP